MEEKPYDAGTYAGDGKYQESINIKDGDVVATRKTGTRYRMSNIHHVPGAGNCGTIRRAVPKVKGKAARKAEKKARRERRYL